MLPTKYTFTNYIYLIYKYIYNNQRELICYKTNKLTTVHEVTQAQF